MSSILFRAVLALASGAIAPAMIYPLLPVDPFAIMIPNGNWAFFPGLAIIISGAAILILSLPLPLNRYVPFAKSWKPTLAWVLILAASLYGSTRCFSTHVCMAGHGCHGMTTLGRVLDVSWVFGMIAASIGAAFSRLHLAVPIAFISGFIISFRFAFGSLGGLFPNF